MSIGLFYSTTCGATKQAAEAVSNCFGKELKIDVHDIAETPASKIAEYEKLIFGAPTMGDGDLSDDWEDWIDAVKKENVQGKTVALFGLGDQDGYPDTFVDALGIIWERLVECGAQIVGDWPTEGYDYTQSKAERDCRFVGLVLDEDNQPEKTDGRVIAWTAAIRNHFAKNAG
jgi:flavodoxin I